MVAAKPTIKIKTVAMSAASTERPCLKDYFQEGKRYFHPGVR